MKLYARTTSERATKGQGGNKEITIDLLIDPKERKEIGRVVMQYSDLEGYTIYYYPINANCTEQKLNSGRLLLYKTEKAKSNK